MAKAFNVGFQKLVDQIEAAYSQKAEALRRNTIRVLHRDGLRWEGEIREKRMSGPLMLNRKKSKTTHLASRRGDAGLRGTIHHQVEEGKDPRSLRGTRLLKFTTSKIGLVHEFGNKSDIVPKKSKWLTIPTSRALTASGIARETKARDWTSPRLRFAPHPTKDDVAFLRSVEDNEVYYTLVKKIQSGRIPPRLGMRLVHNKQRHIRNREMEEAIADALGGK